MAAKASSVVEYLAALPDERRQVIEAVRKVIRANLDSDFEEGIQYGMIGYYIPHRVFPAGYHCDPKQPLPYAALAAQKNHFSLHLMGLYISPDTDAEGENPETRWFRQAWAVSGKKLDLGKACLRFNKLDDLALDVLAEAFQRQPAQRYIERYEAVRALGKGRKS